MKTTAELWAERIAREKSRGAYCIAGFVIVCIVALIVFAAVW